MKNESETIEDLFGKYTEKFTKTDMQHAVRVFANQFRWVETTCGKRLIFDDLDYEVLRKQQIFFDSRRNIAMALWISKEGKKIVGPVVKLIMNLDGRSIIHYKDKNPLNLKRENIKLINHQIAHQKQKKQKTANGVAPTSIYKGVSWNKFAQKWGASIKIDFKKKHLGYFIVEEDAAKEYNRAAKEHWGEEYSNLNIFTDKIKHHEL